MSSPAITLDLDVVQHPTLGTLKFPKDMPPDERNASIARLMAQQKSGLSPSLRQLSSQGAAWFRNQQPGVESPDDQGEPSTPEDRAKNKAYDQLPMSQKAKLMLVPGAMDQWSKQFYGGQLDPHGPTSAVGSVLMPTVGQMAEGTGDVLEGDIAKGGHKIIKSASLMALPLMAKGALAKPLMAARAVGGGYIGSKVASLGAQVAGATPDQAALSEDVGGIVGGSAAATGLARAALSSPTKALAGKVAENPLVSSMLPAKLLSFLKMAGRSPAEAAEIPQLSTTAREVRGPYQPAADTSVMPSGNVDLPPDRPGGEVQTVKPAPYSSTATATVRPAQITAENLMEQLRSRAADVHGNKPTTFDVTPPADTQIAGYNDATQTYIRPSKMGSEQGINDMLAAAKAGEPVSNRVDLHKVSKTAIGESVAAGEPTLPNATYLDPQARALQRPQVAPPDPTINKDVNTNVQDYFIHKMRGQMERPTVTGTTEQAAADQRMAQMAKTPVDKASAPRSNLAKNQRQLANFKNSPSDVAQFQEQAAQELFGKSFNDLPVNDPASRLRATMRAIELQVMARSKK